MHSRLKKVLAFSITGILLSCGSTQQVSVSTWEPPAVKLAHKIKRIGIINESQPQADPEIKSDLEAWIMYSDQELSKASKRAALSGLFQQLAKDPRFDSIVLIQNSKNELPLAADQKDSIAWSSLMDLCDEYHIDAVFALAFHNTDTQVTLKKTKFEQKDMLRESMLTKGQEITLETLIENGWRIYDPYNKAILDEIVLNDQIISIAKGEDAISALQAVESRKDSIMAISKRNGNSFALRLQPSQHSVARKYFSRGTENLAKADSLAKANQWKAASKLWQEDMSHPNPKIRGRAYYNMAVINEIYGDLETAMDWAMKSFDIHEAKYTEKYMAALAARLGDQTEIEDHYLYLESR